MHKRNIYIKIGLFYITYWQNLALDRDFWNNVFHYPSSYIVIINVTNFIPSAMIPLQKKGRKKKKAEHEVFHSPLSSIIQNIHTYSYRLNPHYILFFPLQSPISFFFFKVYAFYSHPTISFWTCREYFYTIFFITFNPHESSSKGGKKEKKIIKC